MVTTRIEEGATLPLGRLGNRWDKKRQLERLQLVKHDQPDEAPSTGRPGTTKCKIFFKRCVDMTVYTVHAVDHHRQQTPVMHVVCQLLQRKKIKVNLVCSFLISSNDTGWCKQLMMLQDALLVIQHCKGTQDAAALAA